MNNNNKKDFKYVGDISRIAHNILREYTDEVEVAVDCTLGNGYDTDFLSEISKKVYAFEIQSKAIKDYEIRKKANVTLIEDSHEFIDKYIHEPVDIFMYNLGFLPGGDKKISTMKESTLKSIESATTILRSGGFITIAVYIGHENGKIESEGVLQFVSKLPKNEFGVMTQYFTNRSSESPYLIIIEKR